LGLCGAAVRGGERGGAAGTQHCAVERPAEERSDLPGGFRPGPGSTGSAAPGWSWLGRDAGGGSMAMWDLLLGRLITEIFGRRLFSDIEINQELLEN
jgi:hypothetical protein